MGIVNGALAGVAVLLAGTDVFAAASGPIQSGPNVQVSRANSGRLHHEVTIAASPTDPGRLIACAMVFDAKDASRHVVAYLSRDGGASWAPTLEIGPTTFVGDPAVAFGPGGEAYIVALALHYESAADHEMLVYRSADAGQSWGAPKSFPFIDREWVVVDQTDGPRRGTLYLHGNAVRDPTVDGDQRIVFTFYRSADGVAFAEPKKLLPDGERQNLGTGNAVVLSDGTYAAIFPEWTDRKKLDSDDFRKPIGDIKLVRSKDGGDTFEKAVKIADWHGCEGWTPGLPILATDASSGPFRDRLYATWPDRRSGRCEVLLSQSADGGSSWSPPITINDDQSPADRQRGRDHLLPAVAVNPAGIVAVSWSDRRDSADNVRGWHARFTASLDGGQTFLPSVALSPSPQTQPNESLPIMAFASGGGHHRPRARGGNIRMDIGPQWIDFLCAADTAGMAAGSDGAFHPLWIDHRTGVPQMWTASVRVDGRVAKNGSSDLDALSDVTQSIAIDYANTGYDPKQRIVSLDATLVNTSANTLEAPLKVRVLALGSSAAVPEILGSANGLSGAGAVWDFSGALPGGRLGPGQASAPLRLRFRLDAIGSFQFDKRRPLGSLLTVDAKVFGREVPPAPKETK